MQYFTLKCVEKEQIKCSAATKERKIGTSDWM
jgi:hypothetical protein